MGFFWGGPASYGMCECVRQLFLTQNDFNHNVIKHATVGGNIQ